MKTIPAGLLAIYASGSGALCVCLVVERTDGVTERFTSTDANVVLSTIGAPYDGTYLSAPGLEVTSLVSTSNLAVDNMEITVIPDEATYPQADIVAGRWDNATFALFECSYLDTTLGINLLKRGTMGQATTLRASKRFELRGLKQAYQQPIGAVTSKTCRARLGDDLCTIDLTLAGRTADYTLTSVASNHVFTASAAAEAADFFAEGTCTFLTGDNAGYAQKIKSFASGVFTLSLSMPFTVIVGDTVRVVAGCRKRLTEDCKTKFNNVLNFQGEPHLVGVDALTKDPDQGTAG